MNILDAITNAQNGAAVQQLGRQFGLQPEQTQSALSALIPALTSGLQQNMTREGGLASLATALTSGNHQRYLENPEVLASDASIADGNGILGHLLGSKDVSRQVAQQAAGSTGIDAGVLKQMLPLVAALAMGGLARHAQAAGSVSGGSTTGLAGMLGPLLEGGQSGSMLDSVAGLAGKLFGKGT